MHEMLYLMYIDVNYKGMCKFHRRGYRWIMFVFIHVM